MILLPRYQLSHIHSELVAWTARSNRGGGYRSIAFGDIATSKCACRVTGWLGCGASGPSDRVIDTLRPLLTAGGTDV
jgi:hypothetical protein